MPTVDDIKSTIAPLQGRICAYISGKNRKKTDSPLCAGVEASEGGKCDKTPLPRPM